MKLEIKDLGVFDEDCGLKRTDVCSDGYFKAGKDGVTAVYATGDNKVEFICFEDRTLAYVLSAVGFPAYYPVKRVELKKPIKAILMDLDGTSVKSEEFWIWIIQKTAASLLGDENFRLEESDLPYVSGHSVTEHLKYCIDKYCPEKSLEEARAYYFEHTHREMEEIMQGRGRKGAFTPSPGLKEFLLGLKKLGIKIGLVTSGLYEKAWPEITSAFDSLDMGKPEDFYDCSISAGFPLKKGGVGTLGELSPKPHPWLYAETAAVGLNMDEACHVAGIEDSGAGVCSIRLAGYYVIGYGGGNIEESGTKALCNKFYNSFDDILAFIAEFNAN